MSAIPFQVTSVSIVCSTVEIKENIKAPRHWPSCGEFTGHRWISRTKGQKRRKCFHLMTSSCLKSDADILESAFLWDLTNGRACQWTSLSSYEHKCLSTSSGIHAMNRTGVHVCIIYLWEPIHDTSQRCGIKEGHRGVDDAVEQVPVQIPGGCDTAQSGWEHHEHHKRSWKTTYIGYTKTEQPSLSQILSSLNIHSGLVLPYGFSQLG